MNTKILNYRIIIEPDEEIGTGKPGFTAYCPTLGIADDGDTIEESLKNIKSLIQFHLKCLKEEKQEIISDKSDSALLTNISITYA